jgi:putative ABC transport system permease protein
MGLNLLKILFRSFLKRKTYSIINVVGLAIGITSFLFIMMYVRDEVSYDLYNSKADRTYRVCMDYDFGGVGENSASMPFPVAFSLKTAYPEMIREVTRVFNFQTDRNLVEYGDQKINEPRVFYADSTFFQIFDHTFLSGDPATALDEPNSVVITESMARKYFRDEDPMGKFLKFETWLSVKVTGVIMDVPPQSHFRFDFIASLSSVKKAFGGNLPKTWVWNPCWTYIVLAEGVGPEQLEANFPEYIRNFYYDAEQEAITMYLQNLPDIHLHSRLDYEIQPNGNFAYVVVLSIIAVFLLLIAAINFMNLSTATASTRAREIGIRKTSGADRLVLFAQFIGESLAMTLIAMVIALVLVEIFLPVFNNFTGKELLLSSFLQTGNLSGLIGLWLLLGLLSGAYPALYLSSFRPISILRGNAQGLARNGMARKVLVVFQFTIAIGLITGTFIIFRQVGYMRSTDLGFNPGNVLVLPAYRTGVAENFETVRKELLNNPDVISVTTMDDILGSSHNTQEIWYEGLKEDEWRFFPALVVDYDFLETFEIELVTGRDFDRENKTDPMEAILVNESMVRHMGWKSNEEALGKKFRSLSGNEKIVGVFRDFQPTSFREPGGPFYLNLKEREGEIRFFRRFIAIKTTDATDRELISFIEKTWSEFEKNKPFEYTLMSDYSRMLYKEETNLGKLTLSFTVLILFVAALGLFGLASFMAEKRTKEIGIRKVMGATIMNILVLLLREFAQLILIATLISWPVTWFLVDRLFLQQFAVRQPFNPWIFLLSGGLALCISMLIISYRAVKASMINPAETLKYE